VEQVEPDSFDVFRGVQQVVYLLNGRNIDGIKLPLGPTDQRSNRYLILLLLAKTPNYKYKGKIFKDGLFFSLPNLKKIANSFSPVAIDFDRQRAFKDVFEKFEKEKLIKIKKEGNNRLFGLTEFGESECKNILQELCLLVNPNYNIVTIKPKIVDDEKKDRSQDGLISLDDYLNRKEIKPLFNKYPNFIGREKEFNILIDFLNNESQEILIVTGEGGIGKTRIVLQTIRHLKNRLEDEKNWNIHFINPYKNQVILPIENKTLIIVDDAKRYSRDLNQIIDYVINPPPETKSKMIIIERSIFFNEIESLVKEKNCIPQKLHLFIGDIVSFLLEYFPWLDKVIANDIARNCRGSFDYASICAEYYKNGGKIENLLDILSWKIEKYINDISQRSGYNISDVKYYLCLLSLIMPINLEYDKEYLQEFLHDYKKFEQILRDSRDKYDNNLIFSEDNIYLLKPDPIADFIKLNALENNKIETVLLSIVNYCPKRIFYNIMAVKKFNDKQNENFFNIFIKALNMVNKNRGYTEEYAEAIVFLSIFINESKIPLANNNIKPDLKNWLDSFEHIYREIPSEKILNHIVASLYNIFDYYAKQGLFNLCDQILEYYKRLYKKYNNKDLEIAQGFCILIICKYCIRYNYLERFSSGLSDIGQLYEKYPIELGIAYASSLIQGLDINISSSPRRKIMKIKEYTEKLKSLYLKQPNEVLARILCFGLSKSLKIYLKYKEIKYALYDIKLVKTIYEKYPNVEIKTYIDYIFDILETSMIVDPTLQTTELVYHKSEGELIMEHTRLSTKLTETDEMELEQEIIKNAVNYDIQQLDNGKFVFILENDVLPIVDPDTEFIIEYRCIDTHVFISITNKAEKNIEKILVICPFRVAIDDQLKRMVESVIESITDDRCFYIDPSTMGITNRKGWNILQNHKLTDDQKNYFMSINKCIIYVFSLKLIPIAMASENARLLISTNRLEKICYCPYCKMNDN
jgi:hypothetical protein